MNENESITPETSEITPRAESHGPSTPVSGIYCVNHISFIFPPLLYVINSSFTINIRSIVSMSVIFKAVCNRDTGVSTIRHYLQMVYLIPTKTGRDLELVTTDILMDSKEEAQDLLDKLSEEFNYIRLREIFGTCNTPELSS